MIPGIVAASGGEITSGGPVSSYPGSVAVADFLTGEYSIDGVATTAALMIDKPGNIVPGNGLSIDWDVPGDVVTPIGDFLTKLCLAEFTVVIEAYEHVDTDSSSLDLVQARNTANPFDRYWYINDFDGGANGDSDDVIGISGQRFIQAFASITKPAIRRVAFTRATARCSVSTNGSSVTTDTTAWPSGARITNEAILGAQIGETDPNFKGYIRRIIVYPVQPDSDLPVLSTL